MSHSHWRSNEVSLLYDSYNIRFIIILVTRQHCRVIDLNNLEQEKYNSSIELHNANKQIISYVTADILS